MKKKKSISWALFKSAVGLVYPKMEIVGKELIPDECAIIVANHAQMNGPIACELNFPEERYTWCAGEMMKFSEVPEYAYRDFWSEKPRLSRPFYKVMSFAIAPLAHFVFNSANTIPVYHDRRIISTFKTTVEKLEEGAKIVIFPEYNAPYNNVIYDFHTRFIDVAKLYHKRSGKELLFLPLYIAPRLKKMCFGQPTRFSSQNELDDERERIAQYLKDEITKLARELPLHTVVPYRNIPKRHYPKNKEEKIEKKQS